MTLPACLPTEKRTLLRFRGPDAERYLNGQLTQDVRACTAESALLSCVTDAKGRLQYFVRIFRDGKGDLLVDAPLPDREDLLARLTKYLIADDVEVDDESDAWEMTHVAGGDLPEGAMVLRSARIAPDGYDVWNAAGKKAPFPATLPEEESENLRILNRIPAWGTELIPGMLPPEAGLDRSAISYRKGCYIGQEVLSRMKTAGKLNRRLAALRVEGSVTAGDLLSGGGIVTSVSTIPDPETGLHPALGYLHKSQFEAKEIEIAATDGSIKGAATVIA
jgi:folate-binding protein YgfZ